MNMKIRKIISVYSLFFFYISDKSRLVRRRNWNSKHNKKSSIISYIYRAVIVRDYFFNWLYRLNKRTIKKIKWISSKPQIDSVGVVVNTEWKKESGDEAQSRAL